VEVLNMSLEIKGLHKKYDELSLFSDFNITFKEGTITCILGPSGCGKTTLLNIIGNITEPGNGNFTGFREKTISYIFQDPRLLPWKTVEENICFVLKKEIPAAERKKITDQLISLMELSEFKDYYPAKLSGGMRQRVSIARAFAYPSEIILMDEPLKGLDIKLKLNLIRIFTHIWQADKRTVIFVTHDVDEALMLGDEIVVMSRPPVEITLKRTVNLPPDRGAPDSLEMKELKESLLRALGG
jgi:NitT/TauT family transport system ATP-binding protein